MKKSTKIAIVDDHNLIRKGIVMVISIVPDFKIVIEANNGKQLIEILEKTKEHPEICILDISMPVLNGYETLKILKEKWPEIKVLMLSMFNSDYAVIKSIKLGAASYLSKEEGPDELIRAITEISTKGYYFSEQASGNIFHHIQNNTANNFSEREVEYLQYAATDFSNKEIAQKMNASVYTVEGYRNSLFKKLNINSRIALAIFAVKSGIVPLVD